MKENLFTLAKRYIPGGVNSPVRSFKAVGGEPFFTKCAGGCYLYDSNDRQYIDYVNSWGANIVGHANEYVCKQVIAAVANGFSYGTPTELEIELAKRITELVPSIEKVRLVSSGTEATMSAIRLARGFTQKKYLVKFTGCYHGHSDCLLVSAGSGLATFATPSSSGVDSAVVEHTLVADYNDANMLENIFRQYGQDIACIIFEPVAGNMNLVKPQPQFLATMRRLCDEYGSLLICDEVMTGFRVALGGAQQVFSITPDLTTLGKIIGGGMPLAAFGGRAEIMDYLSPQGGVYQAGTLSGNPIAVTCGLANLDLVTRAGFYDELTAATAALVNGLTALAHKHGIKFTADYIGGMFGFYFMDHIPHSYKDMQQANEQQFKLFFHKMLNAGVYCAPSMYEANFLTIVHDSKIIAQTLAIVDDVFAQMEE